MTTREGSRASRYGAKDAGSFGTAVSSALPTVDLFRPGFPPGRQCPRGADGMFFNGIASVVHPYTTSATSHPS